MAVTTLETQGFLKVLLHTISNNGEEFADYKAIANDLSISFFFANPGCIWQRGANDNDRRLIDSFFSKKQTLTASPRKALQL